jgi:hypothetical protein
LYDNGTGLSPSPITLLHGIASILISVPCQNEISSDEVSFLQDIENEVEVSFLQGMENEYTSNSMEQISS